MIVILFIIELIFGVLLSLLWAAISMWLVRLAEIPYLDDLSYAQWFVLSVVVSIMTRNTSISSKSS